MNVVQIRDRRLGMLRGRHAGVGAAAPSDDAAAWPVRASEEIALDQYLQQASYDVAFDELFGRCGRALSTAARAKGRR
jgi:hypothetical protein